MLKYKYHPKTKEELVEAIKKEIYEVQGTPDNPNWKADLNCIDVSAIKDFNYLFAPVSYDFGSEWYGLEKFKGNISKWNIAPDADISDLVFDSGFIYPEGYEIRYENLNLENDEDIILEDANAAYDFMNSQEYREKYQTVFNGDIGDWNVTDTIMKIQTWIPNMSANPYLNILPDKIISVKTFKEALKRKLITDVSIIDFNKDIVKTMDESMIEKVKESYPELFIINNPLKERDNAFARKILKKYMDINVDKKIVAKNIDLFKKRQYEERIFECYKRYDDENIRKKAIASLVVAPFLEDLKRENKLSKKNKIDINITEK